MRGVIALYGHVMYKFASTMDTGKASLLKKKDSLSRWLTYYDNIYKYNINYNNTKIKLNYNKFQILNNNVLYNKHIKNIWDQFKKIKFKKIKFEGKGYYIYKNLKNTIAPKFGFAHRLYAYNYNLLVKFLSKTKFIIYSYSLTDCILSAERIKLLRPRNIFTGRGVRFSRSIRYRKRGKVSSFR